MESMGPIYDRSSEHLGSSDLAIINTRRRLMAAARDLANGTEPFAAQHPEVYRVRSAAKVLPKETGFQEGAAEALASKL